MSGVSGGGGASGGTSGARRGDRLISAVEIAQRLGLKAIPTEQQQAVIEAPLEPSIVVAGAGSGKTETMSARVVWLLANDLVQVPELLGLTFTRKAAGELSLRVRQRIAQLAATGLARSAPDPFDAPAISTYNAFAASIYREYALQIGREPEAPVLGEASAWQLARSLVVASDDPRLLDIPQGLNSLTEAVLRLARALSENEADAEQVAAYAQGMQRLGELPTGSTRITGPMSSAVAGALKDVSALPALAGLAVRYQQEKRRRGVVEFADQVTLAHRIAREVPGVAEEYRRRFRVVILDEYQDTSVGQTALLTRLFSGAPVMAVGDPNQSIYGWRGASAANLAGFSRDFTGRDTAARVFELSTSWRNPERILVAANAVAAPLRAASRVPVLPLDPRPGAGTGELRIDYSETVNDEAAAIADWLAEALHAAEDAGTAPPTAAVLCRSLKSVRLYTDALAERGVPFRVLGLGGLLEQPVVVDLVCALRVLHSTDAGSELIRLLGGPRWRIGPKDLWALRGVARWLAQRDTGQQLLAEEVQERLRASVAVDEEASLVDALDFLVTAPEGHGALSALTPEALRRLREAGGLLARLRRRTGLELPELVTVVVQELRLDIEVEANEANGLGRASLEGFHEQVQAFRSADPGAGLGDFLGWLMEAEKRDNLAPRSEDPEPGTVQLLTIHGSKGLEWDLVAVPRFVEKELPGSPRSTRGWLGFGELPYAFRGDAAELPELAWQEAETQKDYPELERAYKEGVAEQYLAEQRRLAYVAVTRARARLLLTGSFWSTQQEPRRPSVFLREIVSSGAAAGPLPEAPRGAKDELPELDSRVAWPTPPLGPREARVREAAERVRRADPAGETPWDEEITVLLEERRERAERAALLDLPARIPASSFKDYLHRPDHVAARLRRPLPEKPYRQTRLGTLFHSWVEQRAGVMTGAAPSEGAGDSLFGMTDLLDAEPEELDTELQPQASSPQDAEDLARLQAIFEASEWAERQPEEVELEIHLPLAGRIVICKIDAVYRTEDGFQIVDWKTGKAPKDAADLEEKQLQLALYRLAFAEWRGVDPATVDALLYFVAEDRIIRPERVSDRDELEGRWRDALG